MFVALGPLAVSLVMSCPMSISLGPSAVCCYCISLSRVCGTWSIGALSWNMMPHVHFTLCISCRLFLYVVVLCLWHSVDVLSCNLRPHFVHQLSAVAVCCCPMFVALGPLTVSLLMWYPMSISLCPFAVYCYVVILCLWHARRAVDMYPRGREFDSYLRQDFFLSLVKGRATWHFSLPYTCSMRSTAERLSHFT